MLLSLTRMGRAVGGARALSRWGLFSLGILASWPTSACRGEALLLGTLRAEPGGAPPLLPPGSAGQGGALGGEAGAGGCPEAEPIHHFDFAGTGTSVVDRRGGAAATIFGGATLDGSGALELDGVDDYVELGQAPWSGSRVSVALWVRYRGVAAYQRLFDFGSQEVLDPAAGAVGTRYLALTPATGYFPAGLAVLLSDAGAAGEVAAVSEELLTDEDEFLVVVVDEQSLASFRGGALSTRVPHGVDMTQLAPERPWLGRSQYAQDPYAEVTYLDLRIYDEALAPCRIAALFTQGVPVD